MYPLPCIDDNLEALKGKKWFCTLHLATGYWQIKMSYKKTAFASHLRLYEFLKMPYGLTNVPATFQCLMEKVLRGFIGLKCLVYLDDVIVFGNTFQETLDILIAIVCRFKEYDKIKDLQAPKIKTGVMAILGLGNYYRHFIKGFSIIVAMLIFHGVTLNRQHLINSRKFCTHTGISRS